MTDLVNALPCPFCGGTDLVENTWYLDDPEATALEGEVHAIECKGCGAGAPAHIWNQRHTPIPRQVQEALNSGDGRYVP